MNTLSIGHSTAADCGGDVCPGKKGTGALLGSLGAVAGGASGGIVGSNVVSTHSYVFTGKTDLLLKGIDH